MGFRGEKWGKVRERRRKLGVVREINVDNGVGGGLRGKWGKWGKWGEAREVF